MKTEFLIPESKQVWKLIESATDKSHHQYSTTFSDFLTMCVCALSVGRMEKQYLQTIKPYVTKHKQGSRAVDDLAHAFGELVQAMETTESDILGDMFQGAITYGEHGQFFTPEPVTDLMASLTLPDNLPENPTIHDPACGSGRTLLSASKHIGRCRLYGTDVDIRCVHMTAINLMLNGRTGYVVHGNTLSMELWKAFAFSPLLGIREVNPQSVLIQQTPDKSTPPKSDVTECTVIDAEIIK